MADLTTAETTPSCCSERRSQDSRETVREKYAAGGRHRGISAGSPLAEVRATRDDIDRRVRALVGDLDAATTP